MGTARGFDRLVFFTDDVTATAITLLILPLVTLTSLLLLVLTIPLDWIVKPRLRAATA